MISPIQISDLTPFKGELGDSPSPGQWSFAQIANALVANQSLGLFDDQGQLRAFVIYQDLVEQYEVLWIWTPARFRGQGAAQMLLAEMLSRAQVNKRKLWLETHENNTAANKLYLKTGFRKVGVRPNYYSDGGAAILYEACQD